MSPNEYLPTIERFEWPYMEATALGLRNGREVGAYCCGWAMAMIFNARASRGVRIAVAEDALAAVTAALVSSNFAVQRYASSPDESVLDVWATDWDEREPRESDDCGG